MSLQTTGAAQTTVAAIQATTTAITLTPTMSQRTQTITQTQTTQTTATVAPGSWAMTTPGSTQVVLTVTEFAMVCVGGGGSMSTVGGGGGALAWKTYSASAAPTLTVIVAASGTGFTDG